jgi:hypothetical protein
MILLSHITAHISFLYISWYHSWLTLIKHSKKKLMKFSLIKLMDVTNMEMNVRAADVCEQQMTAGGCRLHQVASFTTFIWSNVLIQSQYTNVSNYHISRTHFMRTKTSNVSNCDAEYKADLLQTCDLDNRLDHFDGIITNLYHLKIRWKFVTFTVIFKVYFLVFSRTYLTFHFIKFS